MKNNKEYMKQYYAENVDKIKEYMKQYRAENAERLKQYRAENADKAKRYSRQYYAENVDKVKQYYAENADKIKARGKQYRVENVDKMKQYRVENVDKLKQYGSQYSRTIKGKHVRLKAEAKRRGIQINLSMQEYELLVTNQNCHYCEGNLPETGSGLDRIDSNQGYTINNAIPCCTKCNKILGDMSKPEAYAHMQQMLQIYQKKLAK